MKVERLLGIISGDVIIRKRGSDYHLFKGDAKDVPYKHIGKEVEMIHVYAETKRKHYIVISVKDYDLSDFVESESNETTDEYNSLLSTPSDAWDKAQ